jgi:hypothetical protein
VSAEQARFHTHTHSTFSLVYAFSGKNFFQHFAFYAQPSCNLLPHSKTLDLFIASMPYASENIPHVSLELFPNFTPNLCSKFWLPVFYEQYGDTPHISATAVTELTVQCRNCSLHKSNIPKHDLNTVKSDTMRNHSRNLMVHTSYVDCKILGLWIIFRLKFCWLISNTWK